MRRAVPLMLIAPTIVLVLADSPAGSARSAGRPLAAPAPRARHLSAPGTARGDHSGTIAARAQRARGYLLADPVAYDRRKAALARAAVRRSGAPSSPIGAPKVDLSWKGVNDTSLTPGDSTGSVGPTRYVELVNLQFGIYDRSGTKLSSGTLASLTGSSGALTDPQVMWDPDTQRFYYLVLNVSTNTFEVGFSTTDSPGTASDWCKYEADYGYGTDLPDYPKMGDTADFWLIGANVFSSGEAFLRSDVDWITKPAPGSACPDPSSFTIGQQADLLNADSTQASTPVPADQIDGSSQGWVVAAKDTTGGSGNFISVFSVTKNPDGSANIAAQATAVSVSSYSLPPPAPQKGTTVTFDTLDGRLTQAVMAIDPSEGKTAVWTQHTVAGGAGTQVRWNEIDPAGAKGLRSGKATSTSLYAFNGAISPDRVVSGSTTAFGDAMVIGFDTASASAYEAIQMLSKIQGNAQSSWVLVKQSAGKNRDFSCTPVCRWGDYMGASPDPAAPTTGSHGNVWLTSEWNVSSSTNSDVDWRTQNWEASP